VVSHLKGCILQDTYDPKRQCEGWDSNPGNSFTWTMGAFASWAPADFGNSEINSY
jgi:hypothetical protein